MFKICDMVPVTDEYIDGEFKIDGVHYIVENKALNKTINEKSRNFLKQVEIGRMFSQVGALKIREKLIQK